MIEFENRKEKNILNPQNHQEETVLNTEHSKFLYEISIKNDNQIKEITKEIQILKNQMCDILNIFNNKPLLNKYKNKLNNNKLKEKEDDWSKKEKIMEYINNEVKTQINENFEVLNNNLNHIINQESDNNIEFKTELEENINQINNTLLNHEKSIISLKNTKLDKSDYDISIIAIKNNIEKLNEKQQQKKIKKEDDIKNKNKKSIFDNQDLKKLKNEIYNDFEEINLKILNELKNQAHDIKSLYQELQINSKNDNTKSIEYISKTIENTEEDIFPNNKFYNKYIDTIGNIEKELGKKVNLDQLNFALKTQSKLNEALTSTLQISKFCWDSEGILLNNKYIIWSSQNINTALNIFRWENNSELIKILQKGVYKIVVGLIGLESDKKVKIIIDDNNGINKEIENQNHDIRMKKHNNNYYNRNLEDEKGYIKYIEKYFACVENTDIKVKLIDFDNNNLDCSEEAFLVLEKII